MQMVSVERVVDYSKLQSEAPLVTDEKLTLPDDWPQNGEISVEKASLKYFDDSPVVLKGVSFTINAKEKVLYEIIVHSFYGRKFYISKTHK